MVATERVAELLREAAETFVLPRFRALASDEVHLKGPNDYVTDADREAEAFLTQALQAEAPGCLVVGEEASAVDPRALGALPRAEHAFVVDPVDGTRNFVDGRDTFGLMVAETRAGETTRAWIWQPVAGHLYVAERGAGVTLDGTRLAPLARSAPYRGCASRKPQLGMSGIDVQPIVRTSWACAVDYPLVLTGGWDFVCYSGGRQWDHLPGGLMVRELGGVTLLPGGRPHGPRTDDNRILVAASAEVADAVRRLGAYR